MSKLPVPGWYALSPRGTAHYFYNFNSSDLFWMCRRFRKGDGVFSPRVLNAPAPFAKRCAKCEAALKREGRP